MQMTKHTSANPVADETATGGTFYVHRALFQGGTHRLAMDLENQSGAVKAFCDADQYWHQGHPIQAGTIVRATLVANADEHLLRVREIQPVSPWKIGGLAWLPRSWVERHCEAALRCLHSLLEQMSYTALRGFIVHALADPRIGRAFFRSRASRNNHHACLGGLFTHSVECAKLATERAQDSGLQEADRDVTTVAALFHDIGKVRIYTDAGLLPGPHGLDHERLTLEVLASPLRQLTEDFPEAAQFLRLALTWRPRKSGEREPYLPCLLVRHADQYSAAADKHRRAIEKANPWTGRCWMEEEHRCVSSIPTCINAQRIVRESG